RNSERGVAVRWIWVISRVSVINGVRIGWVGVAIIRVRRISVAVKMMMMVMMMGVVIILRVGGRRDQGRRSGRKEQSCFRHEKPRSTLVRGYLPHVTMLQQTRGWPVSR